MMKSNSCLKKYQKQNQQALKIILQQYQSSSHRLQDAMAYVLLHGGKRIRAALVYSVGEHYQIATSILNSLAAAVECIHAYSLVHDDLPAMDDDDLRRGQPSCHKAFDEATAILVGDALQSLAFEIVAELDAQLEAKIVCKILRILSQAIGPQGMVAGQALDLAAEGKKIELHDLKKIHQLKTANLITASIKLPMLLNSALNAEQLRQLDRLGSNLGLAFQIKDDILDIEAPSKQLGKPQGSDIKKNKATYPSLLGLNTAKQHLYTLCQAIMVQVETLNLQQTFVADLLAYLTYAANMNLEEACPTNNTVLS